ncbi:MAG: N-acetylmuramoyl-L-alanine amidase [Pedosphaera sp.]|nr:N-acetylmuramoyl-L-alanine amidase [Pedosphaera sp.]
MLRQFFIFLCVSIAGQTALGAGGANRNPVSLTRWAEKNHFKATLKKGTGEITLSNRWATLAFKRDNKRAVIDGVAVWLAFPITAHDDDVWISPVDVDKTLRPILKPARLESGGHIRTIALSAGHGGKDNGKQVGDHREKDYTLKLALELEQQLTRAGFKVVMTRSTDQFLELADRPAQAKKKGADLLVCLHYNAYTGPGSDTARGIETYSLSPPATSATNDNENNPWPWLPGNRFDSENLLLAYKLQEAFVDGTDREDRGVRRAHFLELAQATMPAAYIEGGFMTNPDDATTIYGVAGRKRLAQSIVDGLLSYKRLVERRKP